MQTNIMRLEMGIMLYTNIQRITRVHKFNIITTIAGSKIQSYNMREKERTTISTQTKCVCLHICASLIVDGCIGYYSLGTCLYVTTVIQC